MQAIANLPDLSQLGRFLAGQIAADSGISPGTASRSRPAGQKDIATRAAPGKNSVFSELIPDPLGFDSIDTLEDRFDLNAFGRQFRDFLDQEQQRQQQLELERLRQEMLRPQPVRPQPRIRDLRFTGLPSPIGSARGELLAGINAELMRRRLQTLLGGSCVFQSPVLGLSQGLRGTIF